MIELRHFRYAVAVAEELHMTRAAARLGLQQPPLSQQIKALEAEIGTPLFHRLPRGLALTDAGAVFVQRARQVLADAEHAIAASRRAARGETGALVIGFTSSAAFHPLVTGVVRSLRLSLPELGLTLEEGSTTDMLAALMADRLDAAFIRSAEEDPAGLRLIAVDREPMVVALPDSHALACGPQSAAPPVALADLRQETFVLYRRPSARGLYDRIIAACHRAGFSPQVAQETSRMVSTLSLVAAGLGLSIIPQSMARLETSGVAYRRIHADADLAAPLHLALRPQTEAGALARFVAEVERQTR